MSRINLGGSSLVLCSLLVLTGCGAGGGTSRTGDAISAGSTSGSVMNRPAATRSTRVLAEIMPWGSVPFDRQTLPLVCPNGQYIATQTQVAPSWSTVLAKHDSQIPIATGIEIYRLSNDTMEFVTSLDQPALLGRSFNHEGFLVEVPRPNGARSIAQVAWESGELHWLVDDEHVNAFASVGPDGRLAWSRRAVDGPEDVFELVIRAGGEEWSVQIGEESWLMPTWSGRGDGLFALTLDDGNLSAVHVRTSNRNALIQSRRELHLATHATLYSAYQTIGAQVLGPAVPHLEQFIFHHPARARMAMWRPRGGTTSPLTFFDLDTFAVVTDENDRALVTTSRHLIQQNVRELRDRREVLAGLQVPRHTGSSEWPYVLLSPQEDTVSITAMQRIE